MAQVKIAADSGGGTIAVKCPATTGSNAARQVTLEDTYSGNATFITKNSNGDVCIGDTTPEARLEVVDSEFTQLYLKGSGNVGGVRFGNTTSQNGYIYYDNGANMNFHTSGAERARITSDGVFCVGGTGFGAAAAFTVKPNYDDGAAQVITDRANTTNVSIVWEMKNNGSQAGRIEHDHTSAGLVSGSDYRLKENDVVISDGITRVKQLRPIRFNWKAEPSKTVDGFFAHEVQSIVPEAVSGEKDAVDEDDKIIMQGMVTERLVPLLTAALKEAITKIETLETKVAALEAG